VIKWILVDYGEVLSAPLSRDTIEELSALAGQDPNEFLDRYWRPRLDYDLGDAPERYWSQVLCRDLGDDAVLVDQLTLVDVLGWLRLNSLTLRTVLTAAEVSGAQLALLSNAPEPLAVAIDQSTWSQGMARRFYSCRLHHAKPDPAVFALVLTELEADPKDVLFIDDRAENTFAADKLGLRTITFTSASALEREIGFATERR
jgi:putative hydrolase of the HAD superfamily